MTLRAFDFIRGYYFVWRPKPRADAETTKTDRRRPRMNIFKPGTFSGAPSDGHSISRFNFIVGVTIAELGLWF